MGVEIRHIPLAQTRALRQRVLRPHQTVGEVAANEPPGGWGVGAFLNGQLIATGIIAAEADPGVWRVRGMATDAPARGQGAGGAVLDALIAHATDEGAARIWCNARTPARSLYERAGFRPVSEEFEIPGIGPHYVMELLTDRGTRRSWG